MTAGTTRSLRVGLLGWGAIGATVGTRLVAGDVSGVELVGLATRRPVGGAPAPRVPIDVLATTSDVIVEAAGQSAVAEHGPAVLATGCDLLVVSVGALADQALRARLREGGPGRLLLTTGAVGGLDLLDAARRLGPLDRVELTTTKPAPTLVQPWMDDSLAGRLERGEVDVTCFRGPAVEAATRFPQSVNVAATVAEAVGAWELVTVRVRSGPVGSVNRHEIVAEGAAGRYRFEIANHPSPDNPRSSAVVAYAVLRSLALLRPPSGTVL